MLGRTLTILAIKRLSSLSKRTLRLGSEHDRAGSQKSKKKGPTFADLEILYWKHVKERLAAQRRLQKRMQSLLLDPAHEQLPLEEGEEPDPPEEEREEGILDNVVGDEGEDDFVGAR
ncbi:condensin-2 complex subunit H2-like [Sphaerodactylus townsendi]|uniref:condensin-2 complex subunit H2-like n=1 Tax=Sphaerodactylus townsendi TaxID=933632 RepID=UPI002025FAA6|nr:condensin-2 complex subunit H2-like [Sphaerodactylus townsendi]